MEYLSSTSGKPRILLADDHVMVAQGIQRLLETEADCELIGLVADGRALVTEAERLKPDVVIVDISLPLLNGLDACRLLKKLNPALKMIALTMHAQQSFVRAAFQVGVSAYVLKQGMSSELLLALKEVLRGGTYLSPRVAQGMVDRAVNPLHRMRAQESAESMPELTLRQREVLQLVAEGKTVKEIAGILDLSVKTVEFHKSKIMHHLGLRTTAELTKYAIANGLISLH